MIEVKSKDVQSIVSATFPNYRRQKVYIEPCTSVTLRGLNWSGGTKAEYRACTVDGRSLANKIDMGAPAPWNNQYEGLKIILPPDVLIVQGGHFGGKTATLRIYVHPDNMPKLLNR